MGKKRVDTFRSFLIFHSGGWIGGRYAIELERAQWSSITPLEESESALGDIGEFPVNRLQLI